MSQPLPYHEPQRWRHCAKHALNALLEGHAELFTAADLYAAGRALPDAVDAGPLTNPHFSFFGGNFDVNVLMACAQRRGYGLDWHDRRDPAAALVASDPAAHGLGFLVNVRRRRLFGAWTPHHWYAIRPPDAPGAPWHCVDSLEAGPVPRSPTEVAEVLQALLNTTDGNLLVLRPLPAGRDTGAVGEMKEEEKEEEREKEWKAKEEKGREEEEEEEEEVEEKEDNKRTASREKKVPAICHRHRLAVGCFLGVACWDLSNASNIFDWSPSVSLTQNFGVSEGLCIDISGFGANLNCNGLLQLHTCKSRGDDTQFFFDVDAREIRSVNYNYRCDEIPDRIHEQDACVTQSAEGNLRLAKCTGGTDQEFEYFGDDGTIRLTANLDLCLAKTSDVGPAGPNERTDFALTNCQAADASNIAWTIVPTPATQGPTALKNKDPPASPTTVASSGDGPTIDSDSDEEDSTLPDPSNSPTKAFASESSEPAASKIEPSESPTLRPTPTTMEIDPVEVADVDSSTTNSSDTESSLDENKTAEESTISTETSTKILFNATDTSLQEMSFALKPQGNVVALLLGLFCVGSFTMAA